MTRICTGASSYMLSEFHRRLEYDAQRRKPMIDDLTDDLRDVKEDLASVADAEGDVLCRAALNIIRALEAERDRLREALTFYATEDVSFPGGTIPFAGGDDGGKRARAALRNGEGRDDPSAPPRDGVE